MTRRILTRLSDSGNDRLGRELQPCGEVDPRLVAEQPRERAEMSAQESRMSPGRGGSKRFSTGLPRMTPIVSATWFTLAGEPAATLKARPLAPAASAARIVASTTFPTYVKSRDCSPSP